MLHRDKKEEVETRDCFRPLLGCSAIVILSFLQFLKRARLKEERFSEEEHE